MQNFPDVPNRAAFALLSALSLSACESDSASDTILDGRVADARVPDARVTMDAQLFDASAADAARVDAQPRACLPVVDFCQKDSDCATGFICHKDFAPCAVRQCIPACKPDDCGGDSVCDGRVCASTF